MIDIEEAQQLIERFIQLRQELKGDNSTPSAKLIFERHQRICIEKFTYLITMRTNRYRNFPNYDDLNQEGMEALIKSMATYNPKKGCFFYWAHHYISTRISRCANLHTTIRVPLKVAKETPPYRENSLPLLIEEHYIPEKEMEKAEITHEITNLIDVLEDDQRLAIVSIYGLDGEKPLSINKVAKKLGITRIVCLKLIDSSLDTLKEYIRL